MYKYFEDLALTMYKNSVWCGVVWLETFTQRKKLPTLFSPFNFELMRHGLL